MTLKSFIEGNKHLINPTTRVVSHPKKGFNVIRKKDVRMWQSWGWTVESSDIPTEPKGASKVQKEINATKGAKELAEEFGVDLTEMYGSGADGRITKADVEQLIGEEE